MKSTTFSSAVNTYNSLIISLKLCLFQQVRKEYKDVNKIPADRRTTEAEEANEIGDIHCFRVR